MTWRRPASRALFGLGVLLVAGALALVVAARTLPSQSMEDLGRLVGALLLAGAAGVPFALALLLARGTRMPRWMLVVATAGCVLAVVPALAFLSAGVPGSTVFGALFLLAALAGVFGAARLLGRPAAA